jgi:hypothetical protein
MNRSRLVKMPWVRTTIAVWLLCVGAQAAEHTRTGHQYPLYCAGIVVGMSTDEDVRRMYGDGLYVRDEGHGGGRYFVDPRHQVTLHVEIGVDRVIDSVSYSRGVHLPSGRRRPGAIPTKVVSTRLTPGEHLWLGIRLGETAPYVIRQFGKPAKDGRSRSIRVIRYAADYDNMAFVLDYEAEFRFRNNRLVSMSLYNGE